jgi:hypothetical protein
VTAPDQAAKPAVKPKPSAAAKRAKVIKAEIAAIIDAGVISAKYASDPLVIKPLGLFAEAISTAFADMMELAESPPVDHFVVAVRAEHPDWTPDQITGVAIQRFVKERGRLAVVAAAKVSSEGNLMYKLAGLAVQLPDDVEDSQEWAVKTLIPGEAMRIVRAAIVIGEIPDYLGESLSILGTETPDDTEDEEDEDGPAKPDVSPPDDSEGPSSDSTTSGPANSKD